MTFPRFSRRRAGPRLRLPLVGALVAVPFLAPARAQNVVPTLDFVTYAINSNIVTASFGYVSSEAGNVTVSFGTNNFFSPAPVFRNQPNTFLPGTHTSVFSVSFAGSSFAEWTLLTQKLRATQAGMNKAVVTADFALASSWGINTFQLPNLSIQNGATFTVDAGSVSARDGVAFESGGRLVLKDGAFDAPSITSSGALATLELARTSSAASPFYLNRNNSPTGAPILLSGNLKVLQTSGYTVLAGDQTYTGGLDLAGGTLALGSAGALGTAGTISFTGGTLAFSSANTTDYSARFSTAASQAYAFDTNGQSVLLASALTSFGGSLTKSGAGTLRLSGNNTYSGGTTLNAGTLALESNTALGTGTLTLHGGTLRASGAPRTVGNAVVLAGDVALGRLTTLTGAITVSTDSTLGAGNPDGLANGVTTFVGNVALDHALTLVDGTGWGSGGIVLSGAISGSGSLTHATSGSLTLSGNNSYSGGTTLNAGTLLIAANSALGTGSLTLNGGTLLASGGSRTVANAVTLSGDATLGGNQPLTFTGNWNLARTRELTVANTATTTISGSISGAGRSLNKFGSGTLVLTGANTYTGGTYIGEGTVRINNATGSAFGTGAVTVEAGATLTGAGHFSGALQNNGLFSPGNSPTLETLSSFTQSSTGETLIELGGLLRGASYDAFNISGNAALAGTLTVVLIDGFHPASGASFNLFDWGSVTGTFDTVNLPVLDAGLTWNTASLYSDGSVSVTGSAIPEPSTYAALAGLAALGLASWRRRARRSP